MSRRVRTPQETFLSDQALAHARDEDSVISRVLGKGIAGPGGCIIWTGAVNNRGYGQIRTGGELSYVHRAAHELLVGPIPDGLIIDHTCHNRDAECPAGDTCLHRRCINPHHLEPVTGRENQRRSPRTFASIQGGKTHCLRGHPFDEVNTYIRPDDGNRQCRQCRRDYQRGYDRQRRTALPLTGASG